MQTQTITQITIHPDELFARLAETLNKKLSIFDEAEFLDHAVGLVNRETAAYIVGCHPNSIPNYERDHPAIFKRTVLNETTIRYKAGDCMRLKKHLENLKK